MKTFFFKYPLLLLFTHGALFTIISAQTMNNDTLDESISSGKQNRDFWIGGEVGMHSQNIYEHDRFGEGINLRLNLLSIPILSNSRLQLAMTFNHAIQRQLWPDLSTPAEGDVIEKGSSININGVEFFYGASIVNFGQWNFLLGPHLGFEGATGYQGSVISIGASSLTEFNSPDRTLQYYVRLFVKNGMQPLAVGGGGLEYTVWGMSVGMGFNIGRLKTQNANSTIN